MSEELGSVLQMADEEENRSGWRCWMLDAIRDVINASFRLTGQHLKGYNSR